MDCLIPRPIKITVPSDAIIAKVDGPKFDCSPYEAH